MLLMGIEETNKKNVSFSQKFKITMSSLNYLCQTLGLKTCISMRDDKFNIFEVITVKNQSDEKVHKIKNLGKKVIMLMILKLKNMNLNVDVP